MLDSFLELSISSDQLLVDIGRLEEYGFQAAQTNDVWTHQYGVMGDGNCHFGLHALEFESPKISFIVRDLAKKAALLENIGVTFDRSYFGDNQVHQAEFTDPSGQAVRLVEARTYSPVVMDEDSIQLGQFQHIVLPRNNNEQLWETLQQSDETQFWIKTDSQYERLTVVYHHDIEQLIMTGTRNGWKAFSITDNNDGLIKTNFGFDFLVQGQSS